MDIIAFNFQNFFKVQIIQFNMGKFSQIFYGNVVELKFWNENVPHYVTLKIPLKILKYFTNKLDRKD